MYFKLIIGAVGCYLLEELSTVANYLCGGFGDYPTVGLLGTLGCVCFLLSANFGQLDGIVDGGRAGKGTKLVSCIVPVILTLSAATIIILWYNGSILTTVILAFALLPMIPASFFHMKHLLMPGDDVGFLKATRGCNICALLLYFSLHLYMLSVLTGSVLIFDLLGVLASVMVLALSISAERGAKKWAISISSFS